MFIDMNKITYSNTSSKDDKAGQEEGVKMNHRIYTQAGGDASWKGSDIRSLSDWRYELTDDDIAGLELATRAWLAQNRPLDEMERRNFELSGLAEPIETMSNAIEYGYGFALIRNMPVNRWSTEETLTAYWGLSLHLGLPVSQSKYGDRIRPVQDQSTASAGPDVRGPQTNAALYYHSDFADIVGLLCIRPAKSGGVSRICSAVAIHDALSSAGRTDLIDALYEGYLFDRKGEQLPGIPAMSERPVPMLCRHNGRLFFRYTPGWVSAARKRTGVTWSDIQQEAFDEVNRLANMPGFALDMNFRPGDIQYLNNYVVLHSRTAFVDFDEDDKKRLLHRIWLKSHKASDLPTGFDQLFGETSARSGIPSHL